MLAPLREPATTAPGRRSTRSEPVAGAPRWRDGAIARVGRAPARAWGALAAAAVLGLLLANLMPGGGPTHLSAHAGQTLGDAAVLSLPAGAQAPISAALGADDPSYRFNSVSGGVRASNPQQHLSVRFTGSTASVSSGSLLARLRLSALGDGDSLRPLGAARVSARLNRLNLARAGVIEWYRNGPLGLEQGFTLARPARAQPGDTLTLSLASGGNAHAALAPGGRAVTFSHGHTVLRYGALSALDARGRSLTSWLALSPGHVLLRVSTAHARYPISIDPLLEQAKLQPGLHSSGIHFGRSVALSADGNTALVGVPRDNGAAGTAWVFTRTGSTWSEQARLEGEGVGSSSFFGRSVALSSNGNVALIGDPGASANTGDAWVYVRSGVSWTPQGQLSGTEESGQVNFGRSVALSGNGTTALIGGFGDKGGVGAAWVFERSGETWEQRGHKLTASNETGAGWFGRNVALSEDGSTALIGGPLDNGKLGAAWVFARSGEAWEPQGSKLTPSDENGQGQFGSAVSLSANGETALIGGVHDTNETGAAWIFQRSGSTWAQQGAKLRGAGEAAPTAFGTSVALSGDANTALIGGLADNENVGAAWVFTHSGTKWVQQGAKLKAADEIGNAQFGWSLALSADASTALIGGIADHDEAGAAWVFATEAPPEKEEEPPTEPEPKTAPTLTPKSAEQTQTPAGGVAPFEQNLLPAPVLGQSGNITQESGTVLLRLPGSTHFTTLKGSAHIPFGTIVDATHGVATITVLGPHGELEVAHYFGGRFLITQQHNGLVVATLEGGTFAKCKKTAKHAGALALAARSKRPLRKLWTNAHGSFTTKGTYAAGAVQGTEWLTEDFCEGTLVVVTRDRVKVTDLVHHRSRIVRAGQRDFVKAK